MKTSVAQCGKEVAGRESFVGLRQQTNRANADLNGFLVMHRKSFLDRGGCRSIRST
jgi:hypothetical protein